MTLNAVVSLGSWVPEPRASRDHPVVPFCAAAGSPLWAISWEHLWGSPPLCFHLSAITVLLGLVCSVLETVVLWAMSRFGDQRREHLGFKQTSTRTSSGPGSGCLGGSASIVIAIVIAMFKGRQETGGPHTHRASPFSLQSPLVRRKRLPLPLVKGCLQTGGPPRLL